MDMLTEKLHLKHGVLKTRIAMAPMVAMTSSEDGCVTSDDLEFYGMRAGVAGMIITGAANVDEAGKGFERQLSIADDEKLEGLKQLAGALKKDGNKAIIQLYHGGREAKKAYDLTGKVLAPSAVDFPFLPYQPEEMSEAEIEKTIAAFGKAANRAAKTGFDGVEIHGANHYLLQQFFSAYSNKRTDDWGGTLEKRMAFPLAVVRAVKEAVKDTNDFIIGYRFSPEEIHGETIGYTIDDSLKLINEVAEYGLDYIHTSLFTRYDDKPKDRDKSFAQLVKETVGDRAKTVIVSGIFTVEDAQAALKYADIAAIGREALIEPQFAQKILDQNEDQIISEITPDTAKKLAFTPELINWITMENSPLPVIPGKEYLL